jgi:hypothetical protein
MPSPTVVRQATETGAVLMDANTGDCFELNRIGADVWDGLARGDALADVIASMETRYAVARETLEADVRALLADLLRHGLLTPRE